MQYFVSAQVFNDSTINRLKKSEIEFVYNHYIQDGDNSAITGGIGTEKLTVYGPALNYKNTSGKQVISLNLGVDIISSASTDKIDFVVSSASILDQRAYFSSNYSRLLDKQNLNINGGFGLSIESDYFSISGNVGFAKSNKNNQRTLLAQFQFFDDDLRWGRVNPDYYKPVKLIYPVELRTKEWYNEYKRYSYNLKLGISQILNKRNTIGIFPELGLQKGLLETPFHRIYFTDGSLAVENLPNERIKGSLAFKLNTFSGGFVILKNTVNGYVDNFGIVGFAIENETAIKVKPFFTLLPNFRTYSQKSSVYFAPYKEHHIDETFFTSDYDLSAFQSFEIGLGIKYQPQKYLIKRLVSNSFIFRYNFLYRSNNLNAHILSLIIHTTNFKKK